MPHEMYKQPAPPHFTPFACSLLSLIIVCNHSVHSTIDLLNVFYTGFYFTMAIFIGGRGEVLIYDCHLLPFIAMVKTPCKGLRTIITNHIIHTSHKLAILYLIPVRYFPILPSTPRAAEGEKNITISYTQTTTWHRTTYQGFRKFGFLSLQLLSLASCTSIVSGQYRRLAEGLPAPYHTVGREFM